ncbi:MAG: hypothetical protein QOG69_2569 [Actinomycetota bacterium]|nr:hypothetical protein [Actinomycetota bacterium]
MFSTTTLPRPAAESDNDVPSSVVPASAGAVCRVPDA